jgi:hypothetical protein
LLQIVVEIISAGSPPYLGVMGFGRNLKAEVGTGEAHLVKKVSRGGREKFKDDLIFNPVLLQPVQNLMGVVLPCLTQVSEDKDGAAAKALNLLYIVGY